MHKHKLTKCTRVMSFQVDAQGGDERLVRKALHACETHGLGPQATVLCRAAGAAAWYAGETNFV